MKNKTIKILALIVFSFLATLVVGAASVSADERSQSNSDPSSSSSSSERSDSNPSSGNDNPNSGSGVYNPTDTSQSDSGIWEQNQVDNQNTSHSGFTNDQMNAMITNSRCTTSIETTVEWLNSHPEYKSTEQVKVGSQTWNAAVVDTSGTAPGSKVYIHALVAQNAGYVTVTHADGTTEKVWKNVGDVIAYIPMDFGSYGLPSLGGGLKNNIMANLPEGMGQITEAQMAAIYDRVIAKTGLSDWLKNGAFSITDIEKFLEEMPEEEVKELLEELFEEIPTTPVIPLPSCHEGNHRGDTEGETLVQNMTTETGWTSEVWARPGDSVQFKTTYCWGAQAVGGSDYAFARTQEYWTPNQQYFELFASEGDRYLFGENEQFIGSSRHVLDKPHNATIGAATSSKVPNNKVDATGDYAFVVYSPGVKDTASYNCMIFDFTPFFVNFGYQIPGVDTGSCAAISQTGNMSDVGKEFTQGIRYDRIQAWQLHKHEERGSCNSCCLYDDNAYRNNGCPADESQRNRLERRSVNTKDNPFPTYDAAGVGGIWGLVNKASVYNNTSWQPRQCEPQACGCSSLTVGTGSCEGVYKHYGTWPDDWEEYLGDQPTSSTANCGHQHSMWVTRSYGGGNGSSYWCNTYSTTASCDCHRSSRVVYPNNIKYYTEDISKGVHPVNLGTQESSAMVHVPYSYRTAASAYMNEGEVVYLGESVTSTFTVNILPRIVTEVRPDEAYATLVDGFIQAVEFIADDIPGGGGVAPVQVAGDDLCNYFGGDCREVWKEGPKLNKEGRYRGADHGQTVTRAVPDNRSDLVGKKYCVAVGISTADSHGIVDAEIVSGMSNPSAWRISNVACRTIAKKPSFQVWNGGLYTNGSVKTSLTDKLLGTGLLPKGESYPGASNRFGSWEEYYVVAAKDVRNFASGAALGYSPRSFQTPGGASIDKTYCDLTKKTISNINCAQYISGYSGVTNTSQQIILERIYSRYALEGDNTSYVGRKLDNSARYIYKKTDDIRISDIVNAFHSTEMYNADRTTYNCNYGTSSLKMCQGQSANAEQTTSNYADGTLVIHTGGKVIIDRNICYGNGACNNSSDVRLNNNSEYFTSMYGLPQVVIIADKGIDITSGATHVDAWLVTNGTINTCTDFSMGSPESACNSTLIVNGPVFADGIRLNRAGGAYPGAGSGSTVLDTNLSRTGSITPGEIFNLRPDTLYWAYSQAQRFTQATATYTRELAPRY